MDSVKSWERAKTKAMILLTYSAQLSKEF